MLKIQSGISGNSILFGNRDQKVYVHRPDNDENKTAQQDEKPAFDASQAADIDYDLYTQQDYDSDKSFLEQQKVNVENLVNNTDTPKPVKTFGKIILGAIAIAMGFVSMKWATLGSWKVAEDIFKNPKTHQIVNGMIKPFKDGFNSASQRFKASGIGEKISMKVSSGASTIKEKFNTSHAGQNVRHFAHKVNTNDIYKQSTEFLRSVYNKATKFTGEKFKQITGISKDRVKSYVSNFFGVSGAVTAGVDAIQNSSGKIENT